MKTYIATVLVEFTCVSEDMVRDRIIGIPFGDSDCGFSILSIDEGCIPDGEDETLKTEYRVRHDCYPLHIDKETL